MKTGQIFAHTGPTPVFGYAAYLQAFNGTDGAIRIVVRNHDGVESSVIIGQETAKAFAKALNGG